jgi:D-alanyl-D-alanine carboxypeptidase (penicillin-binding protein 5/6)
MNARAAEIGCTGTHFANAHGYHDENHYSTAHDLALITREALKHEQIRQIISTQSYIMNSAPREPFQINTSNSMILPNSSYYYEDCIGVKTGTHSKAGMCFVGAAEKDGLTLISVTLNCESDGAKWRDTARLLDYAFTRYTAYSLEQMYDLASSRLLTTRISNAAEDDPNGGVLEMKLTQISDPEYVRMIQTGSEEARERAITDFAQRAQITLMDNLAAPITAGEFVGTFAYTTQDGETINATLIAGRSIEAQPEKITVYNVFPFLRAFENPLVLLLLAVLLLLIFVLVLYSAAKRRRRERRRRELYERRRREYMRRQRMNGNAAYSRNNRRRSAADRELDEDLFGKF